VLPNDLDFVHSVEEDMVILRSGHNIIACPEGEGCTSFFQGK